MNDEELIGYMLGALDPSEQAALEDRLRATPDFAVRLEQLRIAYAPLEADREFESPPAGLAVRTISRLAAYLAEREPQSIKTTDAEGLASILRSLGDLSLVSESRDKPLSIPVQNRLLTRVPRDEPEIRSVGGRFRPDLIVACSIAFLACGLVFSAIAKVRANHQLLACQANLVTLHRGLIGYADTHDGNYPQIGADETADSFATTLANAGQLPEGFQPGCPVDAPDENPSQVRYAYTLGYRSPNGTLTGLHRPFDPSDEHDLLPISADFPTASATPVAGPLCTHPPHMNVLFIGGNVRVTTSPLIGPSGDDIYRNFLNQVAAGLNQSDAVLARPGYKP